MENDRYQLTEAQKRIWFTQMLYPESNMFNIGGKAIITGKADPDILDQAIRRLISKEDSLRIRIQYVDNEYIQYFSREEQEHFPYVDLSQFPDAQERLEKLEEQCARQSFDLMDSKLYQFIIFKISNECIGYIVKLHHVIADGWSFQMLTKRIQENYADILSDKVEYAKETPSYKYYMEQQNSYIGSSKYEKNKAFWNELLNPLPKLQPVESDDTFAERKVFELPTELSNGIKQFAASNHISVNCVFIMSYILYRYMKHKEEDVVVGLPVLGRNNRKEKEIIGMFTNTLVFRFLVEPNESYSVMGKRIYAEFRKCMVNQNYPYNHLINDLNLLSYSKSRLFECCVNYYHSSLAKQNEELSIVNNEFFNGEQEYPMQLIVREWGEKDIIELDIDYKTKLYNHKQIESLYKHMLKILHQICNHSTEMVEEIRRYNANDKILRQFNALAPTSTYTVSVLSHMEQTARTYADRVALREQGKNITYRELMERANSFAGYLLEKGIRHHDIVPILAEPSINFMVAIIGIWKAGAAYLPLDSSIPVKRLEFILEDIGAQILLTNVERDWNEMASEVECIALDTNESIYRMVKENVNQSNLDSPAYVIYTSGSTGVPKGVVVHHRSLMNYIMFSVRQYEINEKDVMPLYSSIAFDLTVTTLFAPLAAGASIAIYNSRKYEDFILFEIMKEDIATIIKLTPAHLQLLKNCSYNRTSITRFIVGGDDFPTELARATTKKYGNHIHLYNEYGPTEATVGCMIYEYQEDDMEISVPIGRPIDNTSIYLLDENLAPVDYQEIGELYIGGVALSKGYLHREELNRESFLPDIFDSSRLMYKTGDLGRFIAPDNIMYLGRKDSQVKINGNRIELQEIIACLKGHEAIREAHIEKAVAKNDAQCLYAYYISEQDLDETKLKDYLSNRLPAYMIPSRLIRVAEFPLTTNGKVDHAMLLGMITQEDKIQKSGTAFTYSLPSESIEEIKEMISKVLNVEQVEEEDDFYSLGGDSIKAIQISSRLKEMNYTIPIKEILDASSIGMLIKGVTCLKEEKLEQAKSCEGNAGKTPITEWFFIQEFREPGFYNQCCILHLAIDITSKQAKDAFAKTLEAHDTLRIKVNVEDRMLIYRPYEECEIEYTFYELEEALSDEEKQTRCAQIYAENARGFDLETESLIRAVHVRVSEKESRILFVAHHLIVDAVSWTTICEDFVRCLHSQEPLAEAVSYRNWSDIILSSVPKCKDDLKYWKQCHEWQHTNEDFGFPVPIETDYKNVGNILVAVSQPITKEFLERLKKSHQITMEIFVACAVACTVKSIFKVDKFMLEIEKHGRKNSMTDLDIGRTVGWFTTMFPAFVHLPDKEISKSIAIIKELLKTVPNEGFSYGVLQYITELLDMQYSPLFRLNYLGHMNQKVDGKEYFIEYDSTIQLISLENQFRYLIDVISYVQNDTLYFNFMYNQNIVSHEQIQKFIAKIEDVCDAIYKECNTEEHIYLTPSDFKYVNLTQKELDYILNESIQGAE